MLADPNDDDDEGGESEGAHLPRLHPSEVDESAVERLRTALSELDGPLSASNALVPMEANDIGDVDERPNPRAEDLADSSVDGDNGYVVGGYCEVEQDDDVCRMFDGPNSALAGETYIETDAADFIEDITSWA